MAAKKRIVKPWTAADDKEVLKLRADGWTYDEIAKKVGRTPASLYTRMGAIKRKRQEAKEDKRSKEEALLRRSKERLARATVVEQAHSLEEVQTHLADRIAAATAPEQTALALRPGTIEVVVGGIAMTVSEQDTVTIAGGRIQVGRTSFAIPPRV
jgi:IS30 family transposase